MVKSFVPGRGDIVWVTLNPTKGHEQSGRRPAFVVSPKTYNKKTGIVLICPITSVTKGYPFEVITDLKKKKIVILTDQLRAIDWKKRKVKFIAKASPSVVIAVQDKLTELLL